METATISAARQVTEVPAELRRWNWAAFLLNGIWAVAHRCYFGLLILVPFVGLFVPFVLGAKGNAWAWRAGNFESVATFQRSQRRWTRAALIAYAAAIVLAVAAFFAISAGLRHTAPAELAQAQLVTDPQVREALGSPLSMGWVSGSVESHGAGGQAELAFDVSGPKGAGKAYLVASEHAAIWTLDQLTLVLENGGRLVLANGSAEPTLPAPTQPVQALPTLPSIAEPEVERAPLTLSVSNVEIRGQLSKRQVSDALDRQLPALSECFGLSGSPAAVRVKSSIAPNGDVQTVSFGKSDSLSESFGACFRRAAQHFQFPAQKGGGLTLLRYTVAQQH